MHRGFSGFLKHVLTKFSEPHLVTNPDTQGAVSFMLKSPESKHFTYVCP